MSEMSSVEIVLFILGILFAIIGFMSVFILNSINEKIGGLDKGLRDINQDLRDGIGSLDRRVTTVEVHLGFDYEGRRKTNGKGVDHVAS